MEKLSSSPVEIEKEAFFRTHSPGERTEFLLRYAVLAPSTHNTQPWLFEIGSSSCKVYLNPSLQLPEADPKGRDLYISMGCCIENLILAAKYFGVFEKVEYPLKENLVAEVFFHASTGTRKEYEHLIRAMPKRMNARGLFDSKAIPSQVPEEVHSLIAREYDFTPSVEVILKENKEEITRLAQLTAKGLRLAHARQSFRNEMAQWLHHSLSRKVDGMPGYALRMPLLLSFVIPTAIRFFDMSKLLAKLNYKSFASAPLVCGFFSSEETKSVWLSTGRTAERIMLECQSRGLQTSIFVASIEMGELSREVQRVFQTNLKPQFLFCIGYMETTQPKTPKHSVHEKLIKEHATQH